MKQSTERRITDDHDDLVRWLGYNQPVVQQAYSRYFMSYNNAAHSTQRLLLHSNALPVHMPFVLVLPMLLGNSSVPIW